MSKEKQQTSISELGEFGLIDRITKSIQLTNKSTVKGVGDDAAILDYKDKQVVVTSDLLTEGIHFNLMYVPLKHLGYKSVVVNLSDVYAMNANATQITVSIAVSNRFPLEALEELYAGIETAASVYDVDVVGGDTTSSTSGLLISITALGEINKEDVVFRNGAKPIRAEYPAYSAMLIGPLIFFTETSPVNMRPIILTVSADIDQTRVTATLNESTTPYR